MVDGQFNQKREFTTQKKRSRQNLTNTKIILAEKKNKKKGIKHFLPIDRSLRTHVPSYFERVRMLRHS
jgi:hypothetical protein